jgi:glycosyltransferase involved in cell wall biosynthesis
LLTTSLLKMGKKIFLIVGSLGAGGSERVYWLLAQYFNNAGYNVSVVFLNSNERCFSTDIEGIKFIDLKTIKASRSFFKLYKLLKAEKPYAVFSTVDNINILLGIVTWVLKIPNAIARVSNNPGEMKNFYGLKVNLYNSFTKFFFSKFNYIVCQNLEMKSSIIKNYGIDRTKLKVVSNPVLASPLLKTHYSSDRKKLIVVCRLAKEKGVVRLLRIINKLPEHYSLTVIGDGPLMNSLKAEVANLNLSKRVNFIGEIQNVTAQIIKYDLFVFTSFTEGFPNVLLESLSVGVPIVCYRVGGAQDLIREGLNGYIVEQNDAESFKNKIILACSRPWSHEKIKEDVYDRFSLDIIGHQYENLLTN